MLMQTPYPIGDQYFDPSVAGDVEQSGLTIHTEEVKGAFSCFHLKFCLVISTIRVKSGRFRKKVTTEEFHHKASSKIIP